MAINARANTRWSHHKSPALNILGDNFSGTDAKAAERIERWRRLSETQRRSWTHATCRFWAEIDIIHWTARILAMNLDSLELDLEGCFCPMQCCRLVGSTIDRLALAHRWHHSMPRTITIRGWLDKQEKDEIIHRLNQTSAKLLFSTPHKVHGFG